MTKKIRFSIVLWCFLLAPSLHADDVFFNCKGVSADPVLEFSRFECVNEDNGDVLIAKFFGFMSVGVAGQFGTLRCNVPHPRAEMNGIKFAFVPGVGGFLAMFGNYSYGCSFNGFGFGGLFQLGPSKIMFE